ncbi:MAG TPA: hypothetical protein VK031_04760 [Tissierellaceae bacterium]|nr:hypothetical protein [Tissierellaceae bacterium]
MRQLRLIRKRSQIVQTLSQEFDNPILGEIRDYSAVRKTFEQYPIIPYATSSQHTSHKYLDLLLSLVDNNPTLNQCIASIGDYCFNSGQILYKDSKDLFVEEEVLVASPEVSERYTNHLKNIKFYRYDTKVDFNHFIKEMYFERKNGNCYVELVKTNVNGEVNYIYKIHPQRHCLYMLNDDDTLSIVVSKSFDYNYLRKYPAREVPLYPEVDEDDEDIRTMFHFKNRTSGLYGRPDWISALLNVYNAYQDVLYRVKLASKDFTPKVLVEIEGDDPSIDTDLDEDDLLLRIANNFTAGGQDPKTIMVIDRPHGASPAKIHEFQIHTREEYYKAIAEINEREILKANGWSKLLLTGEVKTGFSRAPYEEDLRNREFSVLRKYQTMLSDMFKDLIEPYFLDNDPDMLQYRIDFNLPYKPRDDEDDNDAKTGDRVKPNEKHLLG